MNAETDTLIKGIYDRIEALGTPMTEAQIRELVKNTVGELQGDPETARKFRFGKSDSALAGTKFDRWGLSVQDIELAYDLLRSRQESGQGRGPSEELTKAFKAISDAVYLSADEVRKIDMQAIDGMYPRVPKSEFRFHGDAELVARGGERAWQDTNLYRQLVRAMDTAESGYGSQLIGAQYVGNLWEAARNKARIFPLLSSFEMTAPTAYLPVEVDFPELLYVGESTASNASEYGTSKTGSNRVTVTAKKFALHQMWSGEMEEDSIMPYIPFLRAQTEKALAFYSDSLVLNGDDTNAVTNINLDDADPADTKHYLAFDGIRHACLVDNTGNATNHNAAVSLDALLSLRTLAIDSTYMHDWGHPDSANDWIYACDPWTGDAIDKLDEFVSVDKFSDKAVVLTGQVGRVGQHPLIRSAALGRTETDGKINTAGSTACGQVVAFNRNGCTVGWLRRVRTETERLPARDQTRIVHSLRMGFGRYSPTGSASGIEWASLLYDITGI